YKHGYMMPLSETTSVSDLYQIISPPPNNGPTCNNDYKLKYKNCIIFEAYDKKHIESIKNTLISSNYHYLLDLFLNSNIPWEIEKNSFFKYKVSSSKWISYYIIVEFGFENIQKGYFKGFCILRSILHIHNLDTVLLERIDRYRQNLLALKDLEYLILK